MAIVEDISGGRLCSELINANNNTSSIFVEGLICTSIDSKIKRLGISREFFNSHSIMDAECCYEMASGLVMSSLADIVIATCGQMIDDNKSDCFIAVGDKDFIHVFKHSFEGTKNHIIQQISKFAFLHLIKKIRHNDFDFVENII